MKKQLRFILFAALVLLLLTVTAVATSAATFNVTDASGNAVSTSADTLEAAVLAVPNGGTVTVTASQTYSSSVTLSREVTYTLCGSSSDVTLTFTAGSLHIKAGKVTLNNLTVVANSANAIMLARTSTSKVAEGAGTTLTVGSGATVKSTGSLDDTGLAISVENYATLIVNGGTFYGAMGAHDTDNNDGDGVYCGEGAWITVNNGTFNPNPTLAAKSSAWANLFRANRAGFTITINDGTFNFKATGSGTSSAVYANSTQAKVTINGGTFNGTGVGGKLLYLRAGTYTITGGVFCMQTESGYPLYSDSSGSITITGGFFTFMETLKSFGAIDFSRASEKYYKNSLGNEYNNGVYIATTGTVRVSGGGFMGGQSGRAFSVRGTAGNVVISGGDFCGFRAVDSYSTGVVTITGGNFYGNPGQANAKLVDVRATDAQIDIYGGTFDASRVSAANVGDGVLFFASKATINVYGGTFTAANSGSSSSMASFGAAGTLNIGTNSTVIDGVTVTGEGPYMINKKSGAIVRINYEGATVNISGGTLVAEKNSRAILSYTDGNVTVTGGVIEASQSAIPVYVMGGTLSFEGGTIRTTGAAVFDIAMREGDGTFTITGGAYILENSEYSSGGAVLRTSLGVIPQSSLGQYYDPTEMYFFSDSDDIFLLGGLFIDERTSSTQLIDITLGTSDITVTGAAFLSRYPKKYVVDMNDEVGEDISFADNTVIVKYGDTSYYSYTAYVQPADTTYSPVMDNGASVTITNTYDGIRFTSTIPSSVTSLLAKKRYAVGTLIAPADYVAAAGSFTHEALSAWGAANSVSVSYVDITASKSKQTAADGSITFNGALVGLKSTTRAYAAVSYVRMGGVYYYSEYSVANNARSMQQVAKAAYTSTCADGLYDSLYMPWSSSEYSIADQQRLQNYANYSYTLTKATVTPSVNVTYDSSASANLKQAAGELSTALSKKYTSSGATVYVGASSYSAAALAMIEGSGYYIGVVNGNIVIVGTNTALTIQAMRVFEDMYLAAGGAITVIEQIVSNVQTFTLSSETPFVYSHTRDGNIFAPYTSGGAKIYSEFYFINGSTSHLYNKEANEQAYVDYPVYAAIEIGTALVGSGFSFTYVPDTINVNGSTIHVGLTELARTTLLAGKDVGYYGYAIQNGHVVISSFDDATLRLAKNLFLADLPDFGVDVNGDGTTDLYEIPVDFSWERGYSDGFTGAFDNVAGATGSGNVASEVKNLVTNYPHPQDKNGAPLQLSGAVNVDSDVLEMYYQNVTTADYVRYCELLEANGYSTYMSQREIEGSYYVTYVNSSTGIMLHVMYSAYRHADEQVLAEGTTLAKMFTPTLRVISAKTTNSVSYINQLIPAKYLTKQSYTKLTDARLTVVQIRSGDVGYCYVYTLEDGSFVILDGGSGSSDSVSNLYNVLVSLHTEVHGSAPSTSNPVRIAAWFISHGHGDHYPLMLDFISSYCNKRKYVFAGAYTSVVKVEAIIANFASNDEMYNSMDPNPTMSNYLGTSKWPTYNGNPIPYFKVHTGQKFYLANLECEVMYTHDDIHPWAMIYYNNTSTVVRMTVQSHDVANKSTVAANTPVTATTSNMILGDLQVRGSMVMRATFGDYLKSDIVMTAHHGGNGIEAETYGLIDAQIVLWSMVGDSLSGYMSEVSTSPYVKENIQWLQNTRWMYIFSVRALSSNLTTGSSGYSTSSNAYYNLTMTFTKNGIAGLADGDSAAFLAALTNINGGKANKTLTYGTGIFNYNSTLAASGGKYAGNSKYVKYNGPGYVLCRDNFMFEMPEKVAEVDMDMEPDIFNDVLEIN